MSRFSKRGAPLETTKFPRMWRKKAQAQLDTITTLEIDGRGADPRVKTHLGRFGARFTACNGQDPGWHCTIPDTWTKRLLALDYIWKYYKYNMYDEDGRPIATVSGWPGSPWSVAAIPRLGTRNYFVGRMRASVEVLDSGITVLHSIPVVCGKRRVNQGAVQVATFAAYDWIGERFPQWRDPYAYWDLPELSTQVECAG